jgi:hypothetical protein
MLPSMSERSDEPTFIAGVRVAEELWELRNVLLKHSWNTWSVGGGGGPAARGAGGGGGGGAGAGGGGGGGDEERADGA